MLVNVDFHIHSKYSGGTSKDMNIENILKYSKIKGLDIVGTGDCLNPKYLEEIKKFKDREIILTTEVEDKDRVHHLIILPSIEKVEELREKFKRYSKDLDTEGRPKVYLSGREILDFVRDVDGLIGPAHAFTPWTSIYKTFDSIYQCYEKKPDFIELGLSADTKMADMIKELREFVFLSNSDAHSYHPHRLGREFNILKVDSIGNIEENFEGIKKAIKHKKVVSNVGLFPELGKYHLTACSKCYIKFKLDDAKKFNWKCPECGGRVKKGVYDRVLELSDGKVEHPTFRAKYIHIIPLAEIISLTYNRGVLTKTVQTIWEKFIEKYKNEINVLINVDIEELKNINDRVANTIKLFRENKIYIVPGGGGKYGEISFYPQKINYYKEKITLDKWL
ncbi:TIGR00375 family protein [Methanocaldococcus indicus]|uniref:TIGR00375 family protein n=1 Tax=Methanocaldococcus indicus TaxID=213231 RepID=UPI003C6D01BA